jgi:hypothetical protein
MKRIIVWVLRTATAAAAVLAILLATGFYTLLSTGEIQAKDHAQLVFAEECGRQGVVAAEYQGPFLMHKTFWSYQFYWRNKENDRLALGLIQFFPMQTEIWFLPPGAKI